MADHRRTGVSAAAFRARQADPQALLIYNDYSLEQPQKRGKLLRLLDRFQAEHVPIDAVGLQGHWDLDRSPLADLEATLAALQARHLAVMITELDMDVTERGRWWADGGKHRAELAQEDRYATAARPRSCGGRPSNTRPSSGCCANTPARCGG